MKKEKIMYFIVLSLLIVIFSCENNSTSFDNENPSVVIVSPENNSVVPDNSTITIKANASDNKSITEVLYYINGELKFTDIVEPYSFDWILNGFIGNHTIQCAAKDENNNIGYSEILNIIIIKDKINDIDGNSYKIVKIGNQCWMAENLKVTHYNNGNPIPNVTDNTQWSNLTSGAYCNYNNDINNIDIYGLLYNWYAVADNRKIAPVGWHIPSDDEWKEMEIYLGMSQLEIDLTDWRGTDEGGKLKETDYSHWYSPNTGATNSSGFTALPGGYRFGSSGAFYGLGTDAYFWSSTVFNRYGTWYRKLNSNNSQVSRHDGYKSIGFSVRCIRD